MNRPVTLIEPGTVKLERVLPGPIDRVWAYITESEKRAKWLAAGEFELRLGGRIELVFDHAQLSAEKKLPEKYKDRERRTFQGVVTRLEPPHLLAHTWTWNGGDTEVTYELAERGKQVLLTIVHRRLGDKQFVASVMGGWDVHTGILEDVLRGVEPRPFWTTHAKLEQQYAATL